MKTISKIVISFLTFVTLSFSLSAFAGLSDVHAVSHDANTKALRISGSCCYKTDVHVRNSRSTPVYLKIPGTPYYDTIKPGKVMDLYWDTYFAAVELVVYDAYGDLICDEIVGNGDTLEVFDVLLSAKKDGAKQSQHRIIQTSN